MKDKIKSKVCIVPLGILDGYGYVEYFPSNSFGFQVKLYDVFTKTKLNCEQLFSKNPIEMTPRILMNGEARLRKYKELFKWEKLCEREISSEESHIYYKSGAQNKLVKLKDWSQYDYWIIFDDVNFKKKLRKIKPEDYFKIKDLPFWTHYNYIGVTEKIQMYWAMKKGLSLEELFSVSIKSSSTTRWIYTEVLNSRIFEK